MLSNGQKLATPLPVYIDTRWVKSYRTRPFEDIDEVIYVVTWADGRVEEYFTIPNDWHGVFVASCEQRRIAGLAKLASLDAALAEAAKPLSASLSQNAVTHKHSEAA